MANKVNLCVGRSVIEELLDMVPEVLTGKLFELEQELIAEEEVREKETASDEKEPPRKFTREGFSRSCHRP